MIEGVTLPNSMFDLWRDDPEYPQLRLDWLRSLPETSRHLITVACVETVVPVWRRSWYVIESGDVWITAAGRALSMAWDYLTGDTIRPNGSIWVMIANMAHRMRADDYANPNRHEAMIWPIAAAETLEHALGSVYRANVRESNALSANAIAGALTVGARWALQSQATQRDRRRRMTRHLEHVAGYVLGAMRYPRVLPQLRVMPGPFVLRCRRVISAHTGRDGGRWAVLLDVLAQEGEQAARDFAATLS